MDIARSHLKRHKAHSLIFRGIYDGSLKYAPRVHACANVHVRKKSVSNVDWHLFQLTQKEGGSTPTLQFVSDAPNAPAVFFLVEGASLPRRMLIDAMYVWSCPLRGSFVERYRLPGTSYEIVRTVLYSLLILRSDCCC